VTTGDARPRLLDVNVLVSLALQSHVHHRAAHAALAEMTAWATTPLTEAGLVRLLLNPTVAGEAFSMADVRPILIGMRSEQRWSLVADAVSFADSALELRTLQGHRLVTDFHLIDVAARSGMCLATFDASLVQALAPADRQHVVVLPT